MKVLQLAKFYAPVVGGMETVAGDLSAGLRRDGVEVDVLCASKDRHPDDGRDALGVRVTRAASLGLWLSTSMAPSMIGILWRRRRAYDIVHVHMPDPLAALAVFLARPRARLVVHWHSDVVRQRLARHVYRPLERWLLRRADAVVATSRAYADSSPPLQPVRRKVEVIPIGVAPPSAVDAGRLRHVRERHAGLRIVFALGRTTHYKGWEILVQAAPRLPEDVVVVIGGGGPDLPQYRALAERAGVTGRVHFTGTLSARDIEAYFAAAELFCMPSTSRAEAFGVATLEAMARGLAVVASDIPGSGLGWLVKAGTTGVQVPPSDATALADALCALLRDPVRREAMGAAGRARWAGRFTAETMADSFLALYRRLLSGDRAPPPSTHAPDPT